MEIERNISDNPQKPDKVSDPQEKPGLYPTLNKIDWDPAKYNQNKLNPYKTDLFQTKIPESRSATLILRLEQSCGVNDNNTVGLYK